jgi:hypothetical protein
MRSFCLLLAATALAGCLATVDDELSGDERTDQVGLRLDSDKGGDVSGGDGKGKSDSAKRGVLSSGTAAKLKSGEVEEPDPVPWKGPGSGKGGGQDDGD